MILFKRRYTRIKETITPESTLSVCWENSDRVSDTIAYINGNSVVQDRDLADPKTFFDNLPVTFFSQQQITHLTDPKAENGRNIHQTKQLLDLIDGFVRADLQEYGAREIEAVRLVEDAFTMQKKIREAQRDQKKYEQEFAELEHQWKAHHEIENDAKKHNALSAEKRLLKNIQESINRIESTYTTAQEEVAELLLENNIEETPHKTQIDTFKSKISHNRNELNATVQAALTKFIHDLDALKDESWRIMEKELADADENFRKACEALGLSTEAVGHLQEINVSMEKKKHEIDDCKKRILEWQAKAESPDIALDRVYEIWRKQYEKRLSAAEEGNRLAVLEGQDSSFISIAVKYGGDFSNFIREPLSIVF